MPLWRFLDSPCKNLRPKFLFVLFLLSYSIGEVKIDNETFSLYVSEMHMVQSDLQMLIEKTADFIWILCDVVKSGLRESRACRACLLTILGHAWFLSRFIEALWLCCIQGHHTKSFFTTRLRLGIALQSPEVLHFVGKDFPFGLVPENEGARQNRNLKSGKLMARILDQQQAARSLEYSLLCPFVVFIFLSYTNLYSTSFT